MYTQVSVVLVGLPSLMKVAEKFFFSLGIKNFILSANIKRKTIVRCSYGMPPEVTRVVQWSQDVSRFSCV